MVEDSRDAFVRLVNSRVNKVIKGVRLIGNLSNKSNYQYTDEDVEKIFGTLQKELKASRRRFEMPSHEEEDTFKLE